MPRSDEIAGVSHHIESPNTPSDSDGSNKSLGAVPEPDIGPSTRSDSWASFGDSSVGPGSAARAGLAHSSGPVSAADTGAPAPEVASASATSAAEAAGAADTTSSADTTSAADAAGSADATSSPEIPAIPHTSAIAGSALSNASALTANRSTPSGESSGGVRRTVRLAALSAALVCVATYGSIAAATSGVSAVEPLSLVTTTSLLNTTPESQTPATPPGDPDPTPTTPGTPSTRATPTTRPNPETLTTATRPTPTTPTTRTTRAASSAKLPGTKCRAFPASSIWHADISGLPVHPRSADWLASTDAADTRLHPDFGPSFGAQPVPYGIPITITKKKPKAKVTFGYSDESDHVRYPLTAKTKIEGGPNAEGDRHTVVVHAKTCKLYETWDTHPTGSGWYAGSGATWSLRSNRLRPAGFTSADAAGLPILPGLLRWDEVVRGKVDHAIRFTVSRTHRSYLWPARHQAGATNDLAYPPMGARFRLRGDFDLRAYSPNARVILSAMKRHGLIVADNGSDWYFQGTSDSRWPNALISELKTVPASAFEAVDVSSLRRSANSGRV